MTDQDDATATSGAPAKVGDAVHLRLIHHGPKMESRTARITAANDDGTFDVVCSENKTWERQAWLDHNARDRAPGIRRMPVPGVDPTSVKKKTAAKKK